MQFDWKHFNELTLDELYEILQLRVEVFVVEQDCIYQDLDGLDQNALHLLIKENNELIAYARLLEPQEGFIKFGRIVTSPKHRGKKVGKAMLTEINRFLDEKYPEHPIKISAQSYLIEFYNQFGYKEHGEQYLEDGIPHILMTRN